MMGMNAGIMERSSCASEIAGQSDTSRFLQQRPASEATTSNLCARPYPPTLTPNPSALRPHCLAWDQLKLWLPASSRIAQDHAGHPIPLSDDDLNQILTVIGHSLAGGMRESYRSGLLVFHVFCDAWQIPEHQCGPASPILLLSFIANCTGLYSGKMLETYFYGVHAWHLLHGLDWLVQGAQVSAALQGAACLAPPTSKRTKHNPFTVACLESIRSALDLSSPLDAAVYACLLTSFFSLARLGEMTVHSLSCFKPSTHVKPSDIRHDEDRHGLSMTVLHLPQTKMSPSGEDIYFARQSSLANPHHALLNHLSINSPSSSIALFSWRHHNGL
ncbi:hypothetical protein BDR06DRAFT_1029570 [Suillus hirtellus]|nr:hypothetical protein BDR06DRAFT_1029570 [Suillus hirtellus]